MYESKSLKEQVETPKSRKYNNRPNAKSSVNLSNSLADSLDDLKYQNTSVDNASSTSATLAAATAKISISIPYKPLSKRQLFAPASTSAALVAATEKISISIPHKPPSKRRLIVSESEEEEEETNVVAISDKVSKTYDKSEEHEELRRVLELSKAEIDARTTQIESNPKKPSTTSRARSSVKKETFSLEIPTKNLVRSKVSAPRIIIDSDSNDSESGGNDSNNSSIRKTRQKTKVNALGKSTESPRISAQKSGSSSNKKQKTIASRGTMRYPGYYTINRNFLDESGNILIVGEEDASGVDGEDDTLPVRILDDFTVYNVQESKGNDNFKIVGLENYHMEGYELQASGKVWPELAEDAEQEDDDSEDGQQEEQFINLSSIFYVQITKDQHSGENIVWLRTQFAFYRLEQPSAMYANCFGKTMTQKLIVEESLSEDEFSEYEDNTDDNISIDMEIDHSSRQGSSKASKTSSGSGISKSRRKSKHNSASTVPSKKSGVITAEPCVTPLIASLAGDLFNRQLNIADHEVDEASRVLLADEQHMLEVVKDYTLKTRWIGSPIGKTKDRTYYREAYVDGVILEIGDYVYVRNDSKVPWIAKIMYFFQENGAMNYHIRYFSRGSDTILMETAGAREIFLLDNCDDEELVTVMGRCPVKYIGNNEEIPPKDYYYRFWYDMEFWRFEDAENHETLTAKNLSLCEEYEPCVSCSQLLQKELVETQPVIYHRDPQQTPSFKYLNKEYHERDFVYLANCQMVNGIMEPTNSAGETPYNIGQITSMEYNSKNDKSDLIVNIQLFERYDDYLPRNPVIKGMENRVQKPVFKDNKRLVLTNNIQKFSVEAIAGTCRVKFFGRSYRGDRDAIKELEEYKNHADSYYYRDYLIPSSQETDNTPSLKTLGSGKGQRSLNKTRKNLAKISDCGTVEVGDEVLVVQRPRPCGTCEKERDAQLEQEANFLKNIKKLRALDIFSGCGGLSLGLKESGAVDTKYSIEFITSAAETYKHNFPETTVYNDDANTLLSRAIDQYNGKNIPRKNDFGGKPLPDMPRPGDIDLIYCGPPCQGFSALNMHQKADDIKNSLIATSMSYVDFYKPQYFLLENVRGMLQFRLGKSKVNNKWEGGIQMGVVKFAIRCLTAMGYQCKFGLLQAGHHNVPQSRRRLFIWGARIGSNLPDFPLPTTCFKTGSLKISPPSGLVDHSGFEYLRYHATQAPDPSVTVRDAIGDLPGFEYINPHVQCKESEKEKKERILEERWAFRENIRIRRRKAKQAKKMRRIHGAGFEDSDLDGYLSYTDESENEKERIEEESAAAKEIEGRPSMVPAKPYFLQVDGKAAINGFTVYGDDVDTTDDHHLCGRYWTRPQSEFQRLMRSRAGKIVKNHVARGFNELNVERVCRVAMRPDADHKSLPEKLKPWCLSSPDSAASRHGGWEGLFGRLDYEGMFQTAVTEMQPMGKQGKVIHPNQRRVLTVRESARVQGFPDDFEFLCHKNNTKSMYMQVGNAVPPPLAKALGHKLRHAMMQNSLSKGKSKK